MSDETSTAQQLLEVEALRQRVAELEQALEECRRAREAVEQNQECLRLLADHASDLLWMSTADGIPLYVNRAVTRLTGYTVEEALQVPLERQLTPATYAATMGSLAEELARQRSPGAPPVQMTFATEIVRKDGSTFPAEARVTLLFGTDGQPRTVVGVTRDVSERRRFEEQLLRAAKLETIGRLAGGVAHDFNNLLTAIIGHATFARDALPAASPARRDVEQVLQAARRASALVRQLLAFARRQKLALQPTDLNSLLAGLEGLLRPLMGESIELVLLPASDPAIALADPSQIEQVLVNLAVNGRDAMPEGGRLTIETTNATITEADARDDGVVAPGEYVVLTVSDSGTGMTDEVKAHLFEPFFTTKEPGKGTGLGLSTAFGIIAQHQGSIAFESEPGRGTTFRIYLPKAREMAVEDGLPDEDVPLL